MNKNELIEQIQNDITDIMNDLINKGINNNSQKNREILKNSVNKYLQEQFTNGNCANRIYCKSRQYEDYPTIVAINFYDGNNKLIESDEELEIYINGKLY